jgi:hypothetical protein
VRNREKKDRPSIQRSNCLVLTYHLVHLFYRSETFVGNFLSCGAYKNGVVFQIPVCGITHMFIRLNPSILSVFKLFVRRDLMYKVSAFGRGERSDCCASGSTVSFARTPREDIVHTRASKEANVEEDEVK